MDVSTANRSRTAASGRSGRRKAPGASQPSNGERRRGIQLLVSAILFLMVFIGRGVFPGQAQIWREAISADIDLGGVLEEFSQTLAQGGRIGDTVSQLCAAIWGGGQDAAPKQVPEVVMLSETSRMGLDYIQANGLPASSWHEEINAEPKEPEASPEPSVQPSESSAPEVVTAVAQAYTDDGVALPANVSFAYYELGLEETVCPVPGTITSTFGYRTSPITGKHEFHLALDIGASEGTEIGAFADGVVEYIGESDDFGLYLKISHDNQVSSFYAHCSKLLVQKGDVVTCGQTVALVGATGDATGPHLHLTIEKDNIRLDPSYYVEPS